MTRIPNRRGLLTPDMFVPYRTVMPDATCSTERRRRSSNPWAAVFVVRPNETAAARGTRLERETIRCLREAFSTGLPREA